MAAQLVTKRERGRDIGTERAMGGRAEDPIQSTAGRPPREEEENSSCRGNCDNRSLVLEWPKSRLNVSFLIIRGG